MTHVTVTLNVNAIIQMVITSGKITHATIVWKSGKNSVIQVLRIVLATRGVKIVECAQNQTLVLEWSRISATAREEVAHGIMLTASVLNQKTNLAEATLNVNASNRAVPGQEANAKCRVMNENRTYRHSKE